MQTKQGTQRAFRQKVLPVRSSQVRGRNRKVTGGRMAEVKGREVERSEVGKWGAMSCRSCGG